MLPQGLGGLISRFEFDDKAGKLLALIDHLPGDERGLVASLERSSLLRHLLFTMPYDRLGFVAKSETLVHDNIFKCRNCGGLYLGDWSTTKALMFTGDLAQGLEPAELLKWEEVEIDENAVCPSCDLGATPLWLRWFNEQAEPEDRERLSTLM